MPTDSGGAKVSLPIVGAARETYDWVPAAAGYYSRAEVRRQTGRFDAFVPASISHWTPTISGDLSADIEDASRSLSDFDHHAALALAADGATVAPMSAILLRTESASSSQIENLTTSASQLALAELSEGSKTNAVTVLGNVRAMEAAVELAQVIDARSIRSMHSALLTHQIGFEEHAGHFREEFVWIGKDNAGPLGADFVAPHSARVPGAIDDLVQFTRRDDLQALIQIAIAHAQFESIHPFVDGNGRTGRALVQALLRNKRLLTHATAPVSAGLLVDVEAYFAALTAFRAGDAEPIVRQVCNAARYASVSGRELIDNLARELALSREKLSSVRPHAAAWKVLPLLVGQPVINTNFLLRSLNLNEVTAKRTLDLLVDRGVLIERTGQKRHRVWHHSGILTVLDAYAASVRRGRQ